MRECWNSLLAFFRIETHSGAYWALAFAAAVYLAGTKIAEWKEYGNAKGDAAPDSAKMRAGKTWRVLIVLCVWFLLFMNPLTAVLFEKVTGNSYRYVYAALAVPVLPMIAYAMADILNRQKKQVLPVALLLAASLALAGTVFPFDEAGMAVKRSAQWDEAERGAFETVLSEAERLREIGQVPLLVAPKSMMDVVRRYDAEILLAYGRNLWQADALSYVNDRYREEQVLLCQAMEAEPFQAAWTAELALAYGCNLIVLKEPLSTLFLDNWGLSCVYESERFFVYER